MRELFLLIALPQEFPFAFGFEYIRKFWSIYALESYGSCEGDTDFIRFETGWILKEVGLIV